MSHAVAAKLFENQDLMESVEKCEATSIKDKERILAEVRQLDGGATTYDSFVNCLLHLQFGNFQRLRGLAKPPKP